MRLARAAVSVVVGVLVMAALVGLSAVAHAQLGVGRAAIRDRLVAMVNDRMAGTTTLGAVATVWPGPTTFVDLRVRDPRGRPVMQLERTVFWIDPIAALRGGDIVTPRMRIRGGEVRLVETESGKLTIELAFDRDRVRDRRVVVFERVDFAGLRMVIDPEDVPTIVLEDFRGVGRLERTPSQEVELRMDRTRARWVKPTPAGIEPRIKRMEGWLRSKDAQTFELSTVGSVEGSRFALELRYFPDVDPGMKMHYEALDRGAANLFARLGLEAVEGLSADVEAITEKPPREGQSRREERRERRQERREERRERREEGP